MKLKKMSLTVCGCALFCVVSAQAGLMDEVSYGQRLPARKSSPYAQVFSAQADMTVRKDNPLKRWWTESALKKVPKGIERGVNRGETYLTIVRPDYLPNGRYTGMLEFYAGSQTLRNSSADCYDLVVTSTTKKVAILLPADTPPGTTDVTLCMTDNVAMPENNGRFATVRFIFEFTQARR